MLAPRHLFFTALEGALIDPANDSFAGAEEALSELDRRKIAYILLTARTRAEIEPVRRKLGHNHPFITENGGGIYFPDGYFTMRIPGFVRAGRYLSIAVGKPYAEVCEALDDIAEETGVGVTGYHHMSAREIAENTGLRPREAELAREREFDEPFYFTSADEAGIAKFVEASEARGFATRQDGAFWHLSAGCDPAKAVRTVGKLFRDAAHSKLGFVGLGASPDDLPWLRAVNQAVMLGPAEATMPLERGAASGPTGSSTSAGKSGAAYPSGPPGWNQAVLDLIG